ncbi:MAG: hypothetical protein AAF602_06795, partial [Myxococcota bacterium]
PRTGTYRFFVGAGPNPDPNLAILDGCGGTELACTPATLLDRTLTAGETVIVLLDSDATAPTASYQLDISEIVLSEANCIDGIDDDSDFLVDCDDPDCTGIVACTELCRDGVDNDGDTLADCDDVQCTADPTCCQPLPTTGLGVYTADTLGEPNRYEPTCGGAAGAPDVTFGFTAPANGIYQFDTQQSSIDTVVSVLDTCGGQTLACSAQAPATVALAGGQTVVVVVDGAVGSPNSGPVTLTIQ